MKGFVNSYAKAFLCVRARTHTFGFINFDKLLDLIQYFGKVYKLYNLRVSNTLINI